MSALQQLLQQRPDIWKGERLSGITETAVSSGYPLLDDKLAGGGWPVGAITELLTESPGQGELELLLPFLSGLSAEDGWVAFVSPPFQPYAPALSAAGISLDSILWVNTNDDSEIFWILDQALRSGACSAVLGWPDKINGRGVRRLQLAVEETRCCGFLFRHRSCADHASTARLRIGVKRSATGVNIEILKRRGGSPVAAFHL